MDIEQPRIDGGEEKHDDEKGDELPIDREIEEPGREYSHESERDIDIDEDIDELPSPEEESNPQTKEYENEEKRDIPC